MFNFLKQVTAYYLWLPYLVSVCFLLTRLPRFIIISNIIINIIVMAYTQNTYGTNTYRYSFCR